MHVSHADGEAKFWLEPTIELASRIGLTVHQANVAEQIVRSHFAEIVHAWHEHFGS